MPKGYHQLTYEQRCQIYVLKKRGDSIATVANLLSVSRSTIYRELKRNSGQKGYRYKQAHEKSLKRRSEANDQKKKMKFELVSEIKEKLQLQWSPIQISGWLRIQKGIKISHESIYRYIWSDKHHAGVLYKNLRHHGKRYNKRGKGKAGRGCIPNRIDIDMRPNIVEEKSRLGDWEVDTIIGKDQSGAIVSMVDRASKLTMLVKVSRRTCEEVKQALIKRLEPIKNHVHTITSDNGKEFASHQEVGDALEAGFYFAKPYHSWERGLNEHTNGLVRQYLPKSKPFDEVSEEDLEQIEILLNNRPRKVLNFETPIEAFSRLTQLPSSVALHC